MGSRTLQRAYLAINVPLVIAIFTLPAYHTYLWGSMGWLATGAVAVGVMRNRPSKRWPWICVAIALGFFISGDITYDVLTKFLDESNPFPSIADVFYLTCYPFFAAGLIGMVRARRREPDIGALFDAMTVTAGAALLSWMYLIQPYVHANNMTLLQKVVSVAYPLGDILILSVLARLLFAGALRNAAISLLSTGAVGLLVADCVYGWIQLNGNWKVGGPTDLGWVAFYVFWGAAALHPSMRQLTVKQAPRYQQLSAVSLVLLSAATLIAPILLVYRAEVGGRVNDAGIIGTVAAIMFLLVMARMTGLARSQSSLARREHTLREVGEKLVVATNLDEIFAVAVEAVGSIAGPSTVACLVTQSDGRGLERVMASEPASLKAHRLRIEELSDSDGDHVSAKVVDSEDPLLSSERFQWSVLQLSSSDGQKRRVLVAHEDRFSPGTVAVLEALSAQVTLAAERVELAAVLHRRLEEARFRSLVQNTADVVLIVQTGNVLRAETPSVSAVLGYSPEEIGRLTLDDLVHPEETVQSQAVVESMLSGNRKSLVRAEWRVRHADGRWLEMEVMANDLTGDPLIEGVVLTLRDVSERRRLENELRHRAFHDVLTDLANRELFNDRVQHALSRIDRQHTTVAVLVLDLDDFKLVNDTYGHGAGDTLLIDVGKRLQGCLREGDTAARLGGDEFAICAEFASSEPINDAQIMAERILEAFGEAFAVSDAQVGTSVSVGIAIASSGSREAVDLLREADLAMYSAKNAGKHTFRFFEPSLHEAALSRLAQRAELEVAIEDGQLLLHYQPIVRLQDGQIIGAEALVRWQHPERGMVPPMEFIPVAEESGLIVPLGRLVLDQACSEIQRWSEIATPDQKLTMTVNVSARQLHSGRFVQTVDQVLATHAISPASLTLEITESVLVEDDDEIMTCLRALTERGIKIALDDFGTGYSSLSYLHRFPLRTLKIDRAFVADIDESSGSALVDAIVAMGQSLGLDIVAEGIEKEGQAKRLGRLGCQYGQGFLFARPMPANDIETLIRAAKAVPAGEYQPGALAQA